MAENPKKKKYPDLRYKFIRGLVNYEKLQRKAHYLKQAAEWTSKAVVSLEFTFDVIKSVRQATELEGIGDIISSKLREISKDKRISTDSPGQAKFVSAAPALLVALYLLKDAIGKNDILQVNKALIPEMQLKEAAKILSEEEFVEKEGFCQATWRLHVLENRGLLKKRSRDKLPVYELLPPGEALAKQLMASVGLQYHPGISGMIPELTAVAAPPPAPDVAHDHLYTNDDDSDGVVLYVDGREWGGDRLGLMALCQRLDESDIRYATCHLATGDYGWGWKYQGRKVELPQLIERKRADDLAHSLVDGRYGRQKEKMFTWQRKYTALRQESTLYYVVEGDPEMYVVQCADGCGGVGRCGNPDLYQVQECIRELEEGGEFTVVTTPDRGATIDTLIAITRELEWRIRNGDFDELLHHADMLARDMNYSGIKPTKAASAAKRGGKAAKAREERAHNVDYAVLDGLILHGLQAPQPEVKESTEVKTPAPKKQRKRKAKTPVVNIDDDISEVHAPYNGEHRTFEADADVPDLVTATAGFKPRCNPRVASSHHWSTSSSTATSSHSYPEVDLTLSHLPERSVEKKPLVRASPAGCSSDYRIDGAQLPRARTKVRKVHEIVWSDEEEEDVPHPTTRHSPNDTDTAYNKWSNGGAMFKDEPPTAHGSLTKAKSRVDNGSSHSNTLDYKPVVKTESEVSEYTRSPSVKEELSCLVKEERWSAELRSIRSILPDADEDLARIHLDIHAGNVEAAISALLD